MRRVKQIILSAILLTIFNVTAHAQCAMCRGTLESSVAGGDTTTASNLNIGILYLFVAPYVLFGVLGYFWYRTSKRNGEKNKALSSIAG
tara:strand:+ start:399 stop:665 length:267 start_codon:yes stop_codon:yes gene_type:complete